MTQEQTMQQQYQPTVEEVQHRASLVIQSLSGKIANLEVVNSSLVAEIEMLTADLTEANKMVIRLSNPIDPEKEQN